MPKKSGYCGGRVRYNLIMNILVIGFMIAPFIVQPLVTIVLNLWISFLWVLYCFLFIRSTLKLFSETKKYRKCLENTDSPKETTNKIIMMTFIYKEPLELLIDTLENIKKMRQSKDLILAIGLEERTPNVQEKIKQIKDLFEDSFKEIVCLIHPYGLAGEIPGKCSNSNYAQREILKHLGKNENFQIEDYYMINFDTDTRFPEYFISALEEQILNSGTDRLKTIWQPILFYNWDLKKRSFFVRITAVIRNMLMQGCLIPFQLNVMSVFAFSLKLCKDGDFTHPYYQMDDIICYIRWHYRQQNGLILQPLYVPVLSGPTSGRNFCHEIQEWAIQLKRWSIGSAEVFHYYCVKLTRTPKLGKVFLIAQGFLNISTIIALNTVQKPNFQETLILFSSLAVVYLIMAITLFTNWISRKLLNNMTENENIFFLRTVCHWILSPIVLMCYSIVAFYGLIELGIKGKVACGHRPSQKNFLVSQI